MRELLSVGAQVGSLFFYVALGFLGRRQQILNARGDKVVSDIIFYFTMPALTVTSMNLKVSGTELINAWLILAASLVLVVFSYALTVLVAAWLRLPPRAGYAFQFTTAFGNVAYLGFPVAYILFRRLGVFYAAMYALGHNLLFWTLGVWLMQDHEHQGPVWRQVFNINVLAIILGFALALLHWQIPELLFHPLDSLGQATVPLALLLVGSMLAESPVRTWAGNKNVYLMTAIRLIIFPALAFLAMLLLPGWDKTARALIVMQMAMPAAAIAPAVARKYNGDYNLISEGVVATTLISLLTIPFWSWLANYQIMT
ncbi:membrane transport protein [Moorella thermoacetica]|uniref:AEC family transporter n=1 Tax=Neomoorella thermoacetica TaxID=1525 RepID=UPI00069FFE6F|nr:AEC family transporter [Moorella thermoacetica]AKX93623.1 membrane transport protein [Moorella thermoacetica]